jgi:hypothetical protein
MYGDKGDQAFRTRDVKEQGGTKICQQLSKLKCDMGDKCTNRNKEL